MSETAPALVEEHLHCTIWNTVDDGSLNGTYYRGAGTVVDIEVTLTEKDLAMLHPDLPAAVRAQLRRVHRLASEEPLLGDAVANQLHYLTQSPLLLPASSPGERHYATQLEDLQRMSTSGVLLLTAWSYQVIRVDDMDITVPSSEDTRNYVLTSEWLDAHFPGWLPRFEAAEFLGLSGEDLAAHVLTTEPQPVPAHVDTKGITFD